MIFDTHAHYDDSAFLKDQAAVLNKIKEAGVEKLVNVSSSLSSTEKTIHLTETYDWIYGSAGVHPSETKECNDINFQQLSDQVRKYRYTGGKDGSSGKIVAIGEIGLDYYWNEPDRDTQKYWFQKQLQLAITEDIPVIIHSRDAAEDTLRFIKEAAIRAESQKQKLQGVIHCFSYTKEIALEYVKLGFYIGITGVVTFKNAKKIVEAVEYLPMEKLVIETDAPYLAPEPYRGKRNHSAYLVHVIERIAEIKGLKPEEVAEASYQNAHALYRILG